MERLNPGLSGTQKISIKGEVLILLPGKAIFIPRSRILVVADLHLGKSRHFRKYGLAVPTGSAEATLEALRKLILQFQPHFVVFLGDLFHSAINEEWQQLQDLIFERRFTEFILIRGNHDLFPDSFYLGSGMGVVENLEVQNFILTHEPMNEPDGLKYNLCGHLHPGFVVKGKGRQFLRLPCFSFDEKTGLLPAFGKFTGLSVIEKSRGRRIFVTTGTEVIEVKKS
ncbi:MAG: ligase-associated DNA damage response endonuclease PdeM [Saprospirales bacterium]|nr:MAG: ligase-associated DNA damage response endonuclease PdeM [Saprospirales bacterium]